jgi:PAS domain S-box-containing protein
MMMDSGSANRNHARLLSLERHLNDIELLLCPDGRILGVNDRAIAAYGYALPDILGRNIRDLRLPGEAERVEQQLVAMRTEEGAIFETVHVRRDGTSFPVEVSCRKFEADGQMFLHSMVRDISERRRAEVARREALVALRDSKDRYSSVVDSVKDIVFQTDAEGRWTFLNRAWMEVTGFGVEVSLGHPFLEYIVPTDRDASWTAFRALAGLEHNFCRYEVRYVTRAGGFRWIEAWVRPTLADDGSLAGTSGTLRDVTERKRIENRLDMNHKLLQVLNRAQLSFIGEQDLSATFGLIIEDLLELTGSECGFIGEVLPVPEGHRRMRVHAVAPPSASGIIDALFESPGPIVDLEGPMTDLFGAATSGEFPVIANDLSDRPRRGARPATRPAFRCGLFLPIVHRSTVIGTIVMFDRPGGYDDSILEYLQPLLSTSANMIEAYRNEARRAEAESCRREIERKLLETQKLESLGVLAGGIAHDFNNILTGILGNTALARADAALDPAAEVYFAGIEKASHRAAALCRQMLTYSGRGCFVARRIDLNGLIAETVQLLRVSINKRAQLEFDAGDPLAQVTGDPAQMQQILMNLVINASEALEGRAGAIRLRTGARQLDRAALDAASFAGDAQPGEFVFLEVRDTGCGMDPETLARIFDPFFSTKFTGRGLGLCAVLGIIRGHKGALSVESAPGEGTVFRIFLPRAPQETAEEVIRPGFTTNGFAGHGSVLVVDDEEPVRSVAAMMLARLGFEPVMADSGTEALERFRSMGGAVAAVLLDLTMPDMTGCEVLREILAMRSDTRVIAMSGYTEEDAMPQFEGGRIAAFLQKPFSPDDLARRLQAVGVV